jgi:protein-S-isoprenylcysteine O-methyltransferase Ste14
MLERATKPLSGAELQRLQRRRKRLLIVAILFLIVLLATTDSTWRHSAPYLYESVEHAGLYLILFCILGRTWCTLYIGGQKKRALVTSGPYSVVRNPLYLFTMIGAAGIGAQSGSFLLVLFFAIGSLAIFYSVVRQEEAFLADAFPHEYALYARDVPRFWPRLAGWRDQQELVIKPHLVRRTFLDASLFLLAVPIADLLDWLQDVQRLPVLFHLP